MIRITFKITDVDDPINFEGSASEAVDFLLKTAYSITIACLVADKFRMEDK